VELTDEENSAWTSVLALRQEASKVLEEARGTKLIGSSLEARLIVNGPAEFIQNIKGMEDPEGFFIVSQLQLNDIPVECGSNDEVNPLSGVKIKVERAQGHKCPRCWIWSSAIGSDLEFPEVCPRCAGVLKSED
jgi:isoleucyl-tRNA synthetase